MRLLLILATVLTLALTGCAGDADPTDPTDPTGPAADDSAGAPTDSATTIPAAPAEDPQDATDDDMTDTTDTEDTDEGADDGTDTGSSDDTAAGDCSAAGLPATVGGTELSEDARAAAEFLLDAAVRCDEQLLFTAATESETSFFFGSTTVDQVFALPEDADEDPTPWEALARLLHGTTPVVSEDGQTVTWPAAFAEGADDAAWQELVDSGLYTQSQVDELRAAPDGYLGYRTAIDVEGAWLFFTAGD